MKGQIWRTEEVQTQKRCKPRRRKRRLREVSRERRAGHLRSYNNVTTEISIRIGPQPRTRSTHLVEHTVRERRTGTDGEEVPLESLSVRVDVEECRTLGRVSNDELILVLAAAPIRRTVLSQPQIIVPCEMRQRRTATTVHSANTTVVWVLTAR
jgi:hypothetical protein